jgi:DNA repair protein RecO (recombination protein O)
MYRLKRVMLMKGRTRYGGFTPSRSYDGIILKLKKAGIRQQVMTVYTRQEGILTVFVERNRQARQGYGTLIALGEITFDAVEKNGVYRLTEYECRSNTAMMNLTWSVYVYTQIFLEMVMNIMEPHQADEDIYRLLVVYGRAIEVKNPRIVTIIAAWQLIGWAGFYPDTAQVRVYADGRDSQGQVIYFFSDTMEQDKQEIILPDSVRSLWETMLQYPWGQAATLHFKARDVDLAEQLLYSYFCQCSEKKLKSLSLFYSAPMLP